jgi:uncharacterized protein
VVADQLLLQDAKQFRRTIMRTFVEYIVKQMVDYPDEVLVNELGGGQTVVVLELHLNPTDVKKVIGKLGRNIMAIRSLLSSVAAKQGKRAILEICEPEGFVKPMRDDPHRIQ